VDDVNLKKAPQREVLSVERTGSHGKVQYRHRLSCGHTEVRKRPTDKTSKIACRWCVVATEKQAELVSLATPARLYDPFELDMPEIETDLVLDVEEGKLRAGLAATLGVDPESIEIVSEIDETGEIAAKYVVIFMDIGFAAKLAKVVGDTP